MGKKLIIGILDPSLQIDQNLKVGTSIKIHSGQFKLVKSSSINETIKKY